MEGAGQPRARRRTNSLDRYPALLVLLVVDIVALMLLWDNRGHLAVITALMVATLLLGLYTSGVRARALRIAAVAGGIVMTAALAQDVAGLIQLRGLVWLLLGLMIVATPVSIVRHIMAQREVTLRTLFAAISVYLLIGLAFSFAGLGVQGMTGAFFAQSGPHPPADFVYFHFIVMTTVGFGDLSPAGAVPRALVLLCALLGQVFLVTVVARLVSLYDREPAGREPSNADGDSGSASKGKGA